MKLDIAPGSLVGANLVRGLLTQWYVVMGLGVGAATDVLLAGMVVLGRVAPPRVLPPVRRGSGRTGIGSCAVRMLVAAARRPECEKDRGKAAAPFIA